MAISRILEASRIRVNSLGPAAGLGGSEKFVTGGFEIGGGKASRAGGSPDEFGGGAQSGALAAGAGDSLSELKVRVQAPGPATGGPLAGRL